MTVVCEDNLVGLVHAARLNMSSLESFLAGEPCGSLRGVESLYE